MNLSTQSTDATPWGSSADSPGSFVRPVIWPANTGPAFPNYPECPPGFGCLGHADPSALNIHDTHWERFGPSGVVATTTDGRPAVVSTEGAPSVWTPEHALLYAREIELAAQFALRWNERRG